MSDGFLSILRKIWWCIHRYLYWGTIITFCLVWGQLTATAYMLFVLEVFGPRENAKFELSMLCIGVVMIWWSYSAAVLTVADKAKYNPDGEEIDSVGRLKVPFTGTVSSLVTAKDVLQYCEKCESFKEPRAHHCSQCNCCVTRLDHHCPWINNCVWSRNLKAFSLFVLYVPITCSYAAYLLSPFLWRLISDRRITYSIWATIGGCWIFMLCLGLSVVLLFLFRDQYTNMITNMSNVEDYVYSKSENRRYRTILPDLPYPYDLGSKWLNIKSVFGESIWTWPFPFIPKHQTYWKLTTPEMGQFDLSMEQLSQKAAKEMQTRYGTATEDYGGFSSRFSACKLLGRKGCCRREMCQGHLSFKQGDKLISWRNNHYWSHGCVAQDSDEPPKKAKAGWFPASLLSREVHKLPFDDYSFLLQTCWIVSSGDVVKFGALRLSYLTSKEMYSFERSADNKLSILGITLISHTDDELTWSNGDVWKKTKLPTWK